MRARQTVAPRSNSACAHEPSNVVAGPLLYAVHVRVDGQHVAAEREVADRGRGVRADAGQLGEVVGPAVRGDVRRGAVQVHGAPVVAEALPLDDHLGGRRGARARRRSASARATAPARDHALDLGLLQHHLADEDRVGIRRLPPGQRRDRSPETMPGAARPPRERTAAPGRAAAAGDTSRCQGRVTIPSHSVPKPAGTARLRRRARSVGTRLVPGRG